MRNGLRAAAALLVGLVATGEAAPSDALPSAQELMDGVIARLPRKPIRIAGQLITRTESSRAQEKLAVEIRFSCETHGYVARYTIADIFGTELEQLIVTHPPTGETRIHYARGSPPVPAPVPDLAQPVQNTALSWTDLTFAFLWWRKGTTIGKQDMKGESCYVVDIQSPGREGGSYASVRLWISTRVFMLLQAEAFDSRGDLVRRLSVKSFKKINDEWMIKDLEVQNPVSGAKTVLRVLETAGANGEPGKSG